MPESPPPSPAAARRGPPPLPTELEAKPPTIDTSASIDDLLRLGQDEVERQKGPERGGDLRVRLGLLAWDGRADAPAAARFWADVDHPAAAALRRELALASDDPKALEALAGEALLRKDGEELAELGELLLLRGGDPARAIDLLRGASAAGRGALLTALALAGRHAELADLLEKSGDPGELIEAATLAHDRLADPARAAALLAAAYALRSALRSPAEQAYLIERLLETPAPSVSRVDLLRARLELLGGDPAAAAERAATQYDLATAIEPSDPAAAATLLIPLTDDETGFGAHLALRTRARAAATAGDFAGAAAAWAALGERSDPTPWSRACARRAAELLDARASDPVRAEAIWSGLHEIDPGHPAITRALLVKRLFRDAPGEAAIVLDAHGRARGDAGQLLLVHGARAAEAAESRIRSGTHKASHPLPGAPSIDRWRAISGGLGHREALDALARAARRAGDKRELIQIYRRLAPLVDRRRAAAHLTVAGALALEAGDLREADDLLREAVTHDPTDLLGHHARATAARAGHRPLDLADALSLEVELISNPAMCAELHRQLGRVAAVDLKDRAAAEASYTRALELQPDDPVTLYELARIEGELAKWPRAVELRERAATLASPDTAAAWLCEVGEIHEKHLSDDEAARKAYEFALSLDERSHRAVAALTALHRKHHRLPDLIAVLQRELALAPDPAAQLAAHLEIARAADPYPPDSTGKEEAEAAGGDSQVALEAYRDALALDPASAAALTGIERLCRRENRWSDLADALSRIRAAGRPPARVLHSLAEAYEHLSDWARLADAREQEVILPELAANKPALARLARGLAELYETKLDDLDGAARAWHRVDEAVGDLHAVRALERIYQARGRQADLAAALEREIELGTDDARALELWMNLGEIRRSQLGRPAIAADAFERALALAPHPSKQAEQALEALGELYVKLDRPHDLERVIERRASLTIDPHARATLMLQKGEIQEKSGDLEGAIAAFSGAFRLDATSRPAFTSYERVCYRLERWRDAMELYDRAIELVEVQRSRAYRLADLYARRGQVQLQYLGQPGEAAASYLKVLELDPESDGAQGALERIFSAQSDWVGLISAYERRSDLLRDDTKRAEVLRRAARVAAAKLRDGKRAAGLYERLHAVDPTDSEALDALERHFEQVREWSRLVEVLRTRIALVNVADDAVRLYLRIAALCEDGMHDADQAIEAYRKILDVAPSHREALDALGRLFEGTEKWAELVEITRRQIRVVTDRAQKALLYFKCGSVMESKFGKDDDAIRYYDAAIRTSPSCLPAVHGLRDLHLRREDWPKVIQSLELEAKLWTEEKERAGVLAHIGTIYGDKLHDVERAIWYFESALAVDKLCLPANRALFEIFYARKDWARATAVGVILAQKVMREGDPAERSEFYRKRAIVASETGDLASAAESLVVALEIRPDNVDALDLLVSLCRAHGGLFDFATTFRELEKLYRKRDAGRALARVLVAQGAITERAYEIERAEQLYLEALALAPEDFPVVDALVDLHVRLRRYDAGAAVLDAFLERVQLPAARAQARLRLAEIASDCAMDPRRAAQALRALLAEQPGHRDAHFRLAQELYLLGQYAEARQVCERLIQLAAAPGDTSPPEDLARYYDYLGRIAEAHGDPTAAARSYRRAVDLDPSYALPVLALARRAAAAGDLTSAQALLDEAMASAVERGPEKVLELERGLARFHLALGDAARAVETYRQILVHDPASADDRVALAALYARDPSLANLAREELHRVLERDLRHAPAYRLLMDIYTRAGEGERAARVASILLLLGYAGPGDEALPSFQARVRRGALPEELRRARLLPPIVTGPLTEALLAVREVLEPAYPHPGFAQLTTIESDPGLRVCVVDVQRLVGIEAEVLLAPHVPGGAIAFDAPRPTVVLEAALAARPDRERRFLLGRALEPLRGGYALPLRLHPAQRAEVGHLLSQILRPEAERDPQTQEFLKQLPRKSLRAVERLAGAPPGGSLDEWYDGLLTASDRAGLLACDEPGAAAAMLARLGGEELAVTAGPDGGAVALGQVQGGAELVRFFLSDAYHGLRAGLGDPTG